jgi:shikimate 5-dehydrogenase
LYKNKKRRVYAREDRAEHLRDEMTIRSPLLKEHPSMTGLKLFDLTGRVAVITGGSKGLGLSMASGLASAGANIVIVSRHQSEAAAVAEQLATQFGRRAIGVQADVAVEADTTALAERVMNEFGRVDILISSVKCSRSTSKGSGWPVRH